MNKYELDVTAAESITIEVLKYERNAAKERLNNDNPLASKHPDDIKYDKKLIKAINRVLEYFGEN